eukprot:Sspe_Gene.33905::Locus_16499_Transcript_1_1_Confidence_1.000_Length_1507::g.33905::m.33905
MLSRLARPVASRVVVGGQRAQSSFAARYKVQALATGTGSGIDAVRLMGKWRGQCDSTSLQKLWPLPPLSVAELKDRVAAFTTILEKSQDSTHVVAAHVGRGKSYLGLGLPDEALKDASALLGKPSSAGYPHGLAIKIHALFLKLRKIENDETVKGLRSESQSTLRSEVSQAFLGLIGQVPNDWSVHLAHAEYLLKISDISSATERVKKAIELLELEHAARTRRSEVWMSNPSSAAALADYAEYRSEIALDNEVVAKLHKARKDTSMESKLNEKFKDFTPKERDLLLSVEAAIESLNLGFTQQLTHEPGAPSLRQWDSPPAKETQYLMAQYSGKNVADVVEGFGKESVEASLAKIKGLPATPSEGAMLAIQKRLGEKLAKHHLDTAKTLLGRCYMRKGDYEKANKVLTEVVADNAYLDMYHALMLRGEARQNLGMVDGSDQDFKKAFALENACEVDIPTMDKKAYRNEFEAVCRLPPPPPSPPF